MRRTGDRVPIGPLACAVMASVLAGCSPFRGTPTPLPWIPTGTPSPTVGPQAVETSAPGGGLPPASPTAQVAPTVRATATPTDAAPDQEITLQMPVAGQSLGNPIEIRGAARMLPFEGTLLVRITDVAGQVAAEVPITAKGEFGGSATFRAEILYGGRPGPGSIEVVDISPEDGSILAAATVDVTLAGFGGSNYIEAPAPGEDTTLPVRLLARVGVPDQEVNVTVAWDNGTQFSHVFRTLPGQDGAGLVAVSLGFVGRGFRHPESQYGSIHVHTLEGEPLAYQPVHILAPGDARAMGVDVYWVRNNEVVPQRVRVPRTLGIGRAAIETLLWGPVPHNAEGYATRIPSPAQVLDYPGRDPGWGDYPRLLDLRIEDGVAHADFSPELGSHAGGALETALIREQITATLTQFSTVDDVIISINGVTGLLDP